jgi:3-dehydroquinate dehydratase type I
MAEKNGADLIEFRLDYMKKELDLRRLISATRLPIIATNRIASEGGRFRGKETARIQYLLDASKMGCKFVDLELETRNVRSIIREIKTFGSKIIISHHDPQCTPDLQILNSILRKQINIGADICKIITTANNLSDNIRVLEFLSEASKRTEIVSFAMGRLGVISRVLSPVYGGSFTFASVERGAESATGQLTLDEVRNIYGLMRLK